jgi:opacity protein-like surface antigen
MRRTLLPLIVLVVLSSQVTLHVPPALAGGKAELYLLRMVPTDVDSRQYSRPGWGAGLQAVVPMPGTATLLAAVGGLEVVNLLSSTKHFQDPLTGLRVDQETSQNYGRLFVGARFGSHSGGTLRPYGGLNIAGVWYGISTDAVVPDDSNRENEIRQNLGSRNEVAFGWDANAGLDVNFRDRWSIDIGARWLHSYGVPQQLGAGAVTVEPGYVQYKLGLGVGARSMH